MNYMKQVAEMFGVEMGERFKIEGVSDECYFTDEGLDCEGTEVRRDVSNMMICGLLAGEFEIIKKPWKPEFGDNYYFVTPYGTIEVSIWSDCILDHALAFMGDISHTEEEAESHVDEMVAKFKAVME